MLKQKFYLIVLIAIIFSGCAPETYYQMYQTESDDVEETSKGLISENSDIKIVYNFWEDHGTSRFLVFNKTEKDIFIDMKGSHLVVNDIAKTYYKNRKITTFSSFTLGTSNFYTSTSGVNYKVNNMVTDGESATYFEKRIICIPANTGKGFKGLDIVNSLYRDCDIYRYPDRGSTDRNTFKRENSPVYFRNIVSYGFEEDKVSNYKKIEDSFWVSEITNFPKKKFTKLIEPEYCGDKSIEYESVFTRDNPERFFIKYDRDESSPYSH